MVASPGRDIGWNMRERFEIRAFTGPAAAADLCWRHLAVLYEANGLDGILWGGAAKLVLLEIQDTTFGLDIKGGGIDGVIEGPLVENGKVLPGGFSGSVRFWQIAPGISQNIGPLRPLYRGRHRSFRLQPFVGKQGSALPRLLIGWNLRGLLVQLRFQSVSKYRNAPAF